MKPFIFLIMVASITIYIGCKEKESPTPTEPELKLGTISNLTVNSNSLPRTGMELKVWGQYFKRCSKVIYGIIVKHETIKFTNIQEYFFFSNLPPDKLGKINLTTFSSIKDTCNFSPNGSFDMYAGNDRYVASYDLLKTSDNYIFIDSFDKTKNEVTGTMNVTYIAIGTSETSRAIYPDTLRFENAKFTAPLNN